MESSIIEMIKKKYESPAFLNYLSMVAAALLITEFPRGVIDQQKVSIVSNIVLLLTFF